MTWDTDKIIGTGLIAALIIFLIGEFIVVVVGRSPLPMEIAGTIVTGLVGYMGKSIVEKLKNSDKPKSDDNGKKT